MRKTKSLNSCELTGHILALVWNRIQSNNLFSAIPHCQHHFYYQIETYLNRILPEHLPLITWEILLKYSAMLLEEKLPFLKNRNKNSCTTVTGTSVSGTVNKWNVTLHYEVPGLILRFWARLLSHLSWCLVDTILATENDLVLTSCHFGHCWLILLHSQQDEG